MRLRGLLDCKFVCVVGWCFVGFVGFVGFVDLCFVFFAGLWICVCVCVSLLAFPLVFPPFSIILFIYILYFIVFILFLFSLFYFCGWWWWCNCV